MKNNRDVIQNLIDAFSTEPVCVADALSDGRFFLDAKYDALSRRLGEVFWLPVSHAYVVFCYAYSALFGIPDFTREALMRQPDRFSQKRLALTIRSTSGFVLDGFGYDRRTDRYRKDIYWPGPVIRSVHVESPRHNKARISNPAMAYFGYHLIRAAEWLSVHREDAIFPENVGGTTILLVTFSARLIILSLWIAARREIFRGRLMGCSPGMTVRIAGITSAMRQEIWMWISIWKISRLFCPIARVYFLGRRFFNSLYSL